MRIYSVGLALVITGLVSCAHVKKRVHLVGDFPDMEGSVMRIISLDLAVPLEHGKLDVWLDSIETGEYTILINYPKTYYFPRRRRDGTIAYIKNKGIALHANVYLNPDQSDLVVLEPKKGITLDFLQYYQNDLDRSNLFALMVSSKAEDTKVYQELQSIYDNYRELDIDKIQDSLYQASKVTDKFLDDYEELAYKLNKQYNYASFVKEKIAFVSKHLSSPIAPLSLLDVDSVHLVENLDTINQLLHQMYGRAVESDYYQSLGLKIQKLKGGTLGSGDTFVMPSGKTPDLKPFVYKPFNYKYTLVEFWASWCGPCRAKNPALNQVLGKYHQKGFEILGVSLDQTPQAWRDAINKDSLNNWLHVSDLGAWNGANALNYGIRFIPFNFLVDASGHIVQTDISPQDLGKFLDSALSR
jgi:thiol-disulfide isomerase/thioredoxin